MNQELLKKLQMEAGGSHYPDINPDLQAKFAELIVRECANLCDRYQDIPATEPRHCAQDIRSLFGVKE